MIPFYCAHCGAYMSETSKQQMHPKCATCGFNHWQNPIPVAVLIQPATINGLYGPLIAVRKIEPQKGGLALPGGFMQLNETVEEAAVREFSEECGVSDLVDPADCRLCFQAANIQAGQLLLFVRNRFSLSEKSCARLQNTDEAKDWRVRVRSDNTPLCFSLHEKALQVWFSSFVS